MISRIEWYQLLESPMVLLVVLLLASFLAGIVLTRLFLRSRYERSENTLRSEFESELARLDERIFSKDERLSELSGALESRNESVRNTERELRSWQAQVAELSARLDAERVSSAEKLATLESAKIAFLDSFKALSADALRTNNQSFLALALENLSKFQENAKGEMEKKAQAIDELVRPLKESLEKVDAKIETLETARTSAYVSLHEQIKTLAETQVLLRSETGNLVRALRAPSVRGRWGEIQLRRVVELAGMLDHCDFYEQQSLEAEEGRRRPDMVIKLPNGREIAVDAKVPLEAYLRALESTTEAERFVHLRDHSRQIRDHLNKLSQKAYWRQLESPEFTVLFLSGETFFSAALEQDPALIEYGVERKVIVATPTTLIALLRAVAYGWRQEALAENARTVRELGVQLYDRLRTMTEHLAKVGKGLNSAVDNYNNFTRSLDRMVLTSARRFRDLGVTEGKEIPEIEIIEKTTLIAETTGDSPEIPHQTEGRETPQGAAEHRSTAKFLHSNES